MGENILNHPNPNFGNWKTTGVDSRAYNSGYPNQPYDIFHYSDFLTRIHTDDPMDGGTTPTQIAYCPQNARYNDGRYELKVRVTDARGSYVEGPKDTTGNLAPVKFTLDNYQPFIESVTARILDHTIYDKSWQCVENCGVNGGIDLTNPLPFPACPRSVIFNGEINLDVKSSEPLDS